MRPIPQMFRRADGRFAVKLRHRGGPTRTVYLGSNPEQAAERYRRTIAEWLQSPTTAGRSSPVPDDYSVAAAANAYLDFAEKKYLAADGRPKPELSHIKTALAILGDLYGTLPAREFDQQKLEALRGEMIRSGGRRRPWCRKTVNQQIQRVRRMFRWAAARRLVPSTVSADLATVDGLRVGESEAPEGRRVGPVTPAQIEAVRPHVSRQIWGMIQVQLHTGARPGEICSLHTRDLDRTGDVWAFSPEQHKNAHRGHQRRLFLGPQAQEAIRPFLKANPDRPIFSPKDAEAERRAQARKERKTPLSCGNRPGTNRVFNPKRPPGDAYSVGSYRQAIHRACDKAKIPRWNPHQLRHLAADRANAIDGPEGARTLLGHRSVSVTGIYMSRDEDRARKIAEKIG